MNFSTGLCQLRPKCPDMGYLSLTYQGNPIKNTASRNNGYFRVVFRGPRLFSGVTTHNVGADFYIRPAVKCYDFDQPWAKTMGCEGRYGNRPLRPRFFIHHLNNHLLL